MFHKFPKKYFNKLKTTNLLLFYVNVRPLCSDLWVDRSEPVLPLLTFVQKKGNTTFYEWRTGNTPVIVEKPVMEEAPADTVTEETVSLQHILGEALVEHN